MKFVCEGGHLNLPEFTTKLPDILILEPMCTIGLESGFSNSLGEPPMSTDPVKPPDIRFLSSQFRKRYPHHGKAVRAGPTLYLYIKHSRL
ncbi:unnamed protein product [Schistosoma curassoni]|uniref:Uncharacterized protein n=1 Tax=Schistosoma curassoni TaxID=6186 RepID=A0A183JQI3_9TREM|nr:unnamed protein product [Schistosoma curassoni]